MSGGRDSSVSPWLKTNIMPARQPPTPAVHPACHPKSSREIKRGRQSWLRWQASIISKFLMRPPHSSSVQRTGIVACIFICSLLGAGTAVSGRWVALTFKIGKTVWIQSLHYPNIPLRHPERGGMVVARTCTEVGTESRRRHISRKKNVEDRVIWIFYTFKKFWCAFSVVLWKYQVWY